MEDRFGWNGSVLGAPKGHPPKGHREDMICDKCQVEI